MKGTDPILRNGCQVTYGYDDLYRLTSETIPCSAAPGGADSGRHGLPVRPSGQPPGATSSVPAIPPPAGTLFYDANANTLSYGSKANLYDFENRLVQRGGVTIVYDGDGNRVRKAVGGVTTHLRVNHLSRDYSLPLKLIW